MQNKSLRGELHARHLWLIGFLAALSMANEAGAGELFPSRKFAAGDAPFSVTVADLNGDSILDLVNANEWSHDVSVLLGNGDGSFQIADFFVAGFSTESVAVADLDGDSFPDLVTANEYTNDVSVLINLPEPSARLAFLAGVGLLGLLRRRQKSKRRCSI